MDFIFTLKDGSHCEIAFSCGHPDIENNQCRQDSGTARTAVMVWRACRSKMR